MDPPKSSLVEIIHEARPEPAQKPGAFEKIRRAVTGGVERTARIKLERDRTDISGLAERSFAATYDPYFVQTEFETIQSEKVLGKVVDSLNLKQEWGKKNRGGRERTRTEAIGMLKGKLDLKHVGVGGHSFGAHTAMAVAGQGPGNTSVAATRVMSLRDDRVIAAIAMSPNVPVIRSNLDQVFAASRVLADDLANIHALPGECRLDRDIRPLARIRAQPAHRDHALAHRFKPHRDGRSLSAGSGLGADDRLAAALQPGDAGVGCIEIGIPVRGLA